MPATPGVIVAPKRIGGYSAASGYSCRICELPDDIMQAVNAAIWTPERVRYRAYRRNALAVLATHGQTIHADTVTRHAAHVEVSWRKASAKDPAVGTEKPLFPLDFEQYVSRASAIGGKAMDVIEASLPLLKGTDLVATARLGVSALAARQQAADAAAAREAKSKQPTTRLLAIYGIVSGHLDTPAGEIRNVTPVAELMAELNAERDQLRLAAGYEDELALDIEDALA